MKTTLPRLVLLSSLLVLVASAAVPPDTLTPKEIAQGFREHRVLAKPRGIYRETVDAVEQRERVRLRRSFDRIGGLRVLELDAGDSADAAIQRLRATGRYEYVERDHLHHTRVTPNDANFTQQWSLNNTGQGSGTPGADIGATTAWASATDASSVIVAVVDTGIRLTHGDLAANLWSNSSGKHGINAILATSSANYTHPDDDSEAGHGTHVAGIIGAVGNNGTGISGVAWKTKLMALKFLAADRSGGSTSDSIECINYALANGAKILNASYGGGPFQQSEFDAIKAARTAGAIMVVAAGNDTADNDVVVDYPSGYALDNIVAVAASDRRDQLDTTYAGSNHGSGSVELAAPGERIYSTLNSSDSAYGTLSGTSMAAPHVSGALALLKARFPGDTYRQLINRLLRGTTRLATLSGQVQTGGRLNLAQALATTTNRPFNDQFDESATVSGTNIRIRANNVGATLDSGEPVHAGATGGASLWWSWTAPASTLVTFDTLGSAVKNDNGADSALDTTLAIYTGDSLATLAPFAASDNAPGAVTSRVTATVTAGTTYRIAVDGKNGASGYLALKIGAVPANDDFVNATAVTGTSLSVNGLLLNAGSEAGEPSPPGSEADHSVWYRWTAPSTATFSLAVFATEIDTIVAVYTGSSVAALTSVGGNDNSATNNSDALVRFNATAGTIYYFQVDHTTSSSQSEGGEFTLTLTDSAWQAPAGDEITSSPAVGADGTIYFGAGSSNEYDTSVYAVTAAGTRKWTKALGGQGVIGASPAIGADGTVYIGGDDKILYALAPATGATKWTFTADTGIYSTPAIASDGTIYFRDDTKLYALTPEGSLKWSFTLSGSTAGGTYCSPAIGTNGTLYVGTNGGAFHAITDNGTNATQKWVFTADDDIYTSPAIAADGTLYFATLNGTVYALADSTTAATLQWSWSIADHSSITSSIALGADGSLYFAAYDHKLYALSRTGTLKWSHDLGDEVRASSPAVAADGTIYVGCYDAQVHAINADGTLRRVYHTARQIRSSPAIAGSRLYFGSADAKLYAFDLGQDNVASAWPMFHQNAARLGRASTAAFAITSQPQAAFVIIGTTLSVTVGVSGGSNLTYQWYKDGAALIGATATTYSKAAAGTGDSGSYTVTITSAAGSVTSNAAQITVAAAGTNSRIVNLAARGRVGTGDNVLIAGFVLNGTPAKALLIQGVGPTLTTLGVTSALADPQLELKSSAGVTLDANDNWSGQTALRSALGATQLDASSKDAALLTTTLAPGPYSVIIRGTNETSGVALAELYDTNSAGGARLVNIAARAHVGTGADTLFAGFVIVGNGPVRVLVRALGPALTALGVSGALVDPQLEVYRSVNGVSTRIEVNDDWDASLASTFATVGAQPLTTAKDSALLLTLEPGVYSTQVSGVANATGVALVEVYEVP